MKWCVCVLSFFAASTAVLYYLILLEENQKSPVEHLRPSFDKHYRLFGGDENVNRVLRRIGVNPMNVHLGYSVPEVVVLKAEDDVYSLTQYYQLTKVELRFKLGEEFEETCVHNGGSLRSVITQFKNNLTHVQIREGNRFPLITRRVFKAEELVVELRVGDLASSLVYLPVREET
ncbi:fatty acid-binding protein-like [Macrosteles quadrilineatus]|uniref:fatty acid-binding protein-like n=1 Tax=Macrosteles quadrilineatus TaxID=74068 RepID=UPI0023E0E61A|nr:fatty acid-binding protein-like [Macrosteles quadrilineatus]